RRRLGLAPRPAPTTRDWIVIPLLLVGGIVVPLLGWLVGVVLLWMSQVWSLRQKWLGTLVLPGGLAFALLLALLSAHSGAGGCAPNPEPSLSLGPAGTPAVDVPGAGSCPTGSGSAPWLGVTLAVLTVALPLLTAGHLARVAQRAARSSAADADA